MKNSLLKGNLKMTVQKKVKEIGMNNEEIIIRHIDKTIIRTCNWLEQILSEEESQINPTATIKALAELLSARALITDVLKEHFNQ